jgi:hypothetical protein
LEEIKGDINEWVLTQVKEDIAEAEDYRDAIIKPAIRIRYEAYYADIEYYQKKFPKLSKFSNIVDHTIHDTIEWAMPSMMRIFFQNDDLVTITGVSEEDEVGAQVMTSLLKYQLQRASGNTYSIIYSWIKDSLITGIGILKVYWEREEKTKSNNEVVGFQTLQRMQTDPSVTVLNATPLDDFGNFQVEYQTTYYNKNNPKLENILISEFLFSPRAKTLTEATFIAHRKAVTLSYLRQKEADGIYSNIDKVQESAEERTLDDLEQYLRDDYYPLNTSRDVASREVIIYECYKKIDINQDGILEDMIITVCDNTILRIEPNIYGRAPFFILVPISDPHRIFPKRSYADLISP